MTETEGKHGLTWAMVLGVVFAAPALLAFAMIGAERIFTVLKILAWGVVVCGGILALSAPIRQWRRGEERPETVREIVKDGTQRIREIHYGTPPKYQLGEPMTADPMAFPGMVRAAYSAGLQGGQQTSYAPAGAMQPLDDWPAEATDGVNDVPPPAGWDGEILQ
jgi:hypothetical protein